MLKPISLECHGVKDRAEGKQFRPAITGFIA
jgi:hypothetical protein